MNICLVHEEYPEETNFGGIATYQKISAEEYVKQNNNVIVICRGLKKDLDSQSDNIKSNDDPYYNIKKETLYPIKSNVAEMYKNVMEAVSKRIRNQIALSADCNPHYKKIDTICRSYLNQFQDSIKNGRISENDFYFYYRIVVCQLTNSMLQECLNRDDIHGSIRFLSFITYLNLSNERMFSHIKNSGEFVIDHSRIGGPKRDIVISGNVEDNELNIAKIRDLFDVITAIAGYYQDYWLIEDFENSPNYSITEDKKNAFISFMKEYGNNKDLSPYLKCFDQYHYDLLKKIMKEEGEKEALWENEVYRSYFERIGMLLMYIQSSKAKTYLELILDNKKEELNSINNRIENYSDSYILTKYMNSLTNKN